MSKLISPGVDVKILHEDFYISGSAATVPLLFIATQDEKFQVDGTTPALGTFESGVLRTVTSVRQALDLYGAPKFYASADGRPHHGDSRNEYGLDALIKVLEVNRRAYVIRANINLNDSLEFVKDLWDKKITDAGVNLSELVSEYLTQWNELYGYLPADVAYKTTVDKATLKALVREATASTFSSYSFSKDAFARAFLEDHTEERAGYHDVNYFVYTAGPNNYVTADSPTNLDPLATYSAVIKIQAATSTLTISGEAVETFGDVVTAINTLLGSTGSAALVNGRIRISSSSLGATSVAEIVGNGPATPLFPSIDGFGRYESPVKGTGIQSLDVYDTDYETVIGGYDGLDDMVNTWTAGADVPAEFTPSEAEGLLLAAAVDFSNTKDFKLLTSLGSNDSLRRVEIVRALQEAVNNPYSNARSEALEYNLVAAPGYPELSDELLRLSASMFDEIFVIGETPLDKPPTGPNSIANWATSGGRSTSDSIGYWYGHGITSNIDGNDIVTTAGTTALRTLAYSDSTSEGEWIAPAGATRGQCPHLSDVGYVSGALGQPTTFVREWLDNGTRDELYEWPKCINPVTYIPGRGFLVMGQKTASGVQQATDRVAVSRLTKYIKRQLRKSLFAFLFEPNDEITRNNVKAAADNFLSTLIDRRALYDFATICDEENNTPQTIDANELYLDIAIKPVKAVEFIYVRVRIVRTGANIGTKKAIT